MAAAASSDDVVILEVPAVRFGDRAEEELRAIGLKGKARSLARLLTHVPKNTHNEA